MGEYKIVFQFFQSSIYQNILETAHHTFLSTYNLLILIVVTWSRIIRNVQGRGDKRGPLNLDRR